MRIDKCFFCSGPVYPGHGTMYIRNDCKTFKFCRSKCLRHFKAKHNARKMKWTKAYRKTHGKELMYDTTLDFEKKKEEPIRYNRDTYVKTIQAMGRIEEIKKKREKRYKNERVKEAKKRNNDLVDRILTRKADYIKNKDVKDKFKDKQNQKIKEALAKVKKSKLEEELMVNSEEEEDDEESDSEGSGMEEEDMEEVDA